VLLSGRRHERSGENEVVTPLHAAVGAAVTVLFWAAGLLGGWRWWRVEPSPLFWRLLRAAQGLLVLEAALGGILLLAGRRPDDGLHYLYGLLPLAVGFVAEQLRLAAADTVLAARDLPSAQAVGSLPEAEQRSVVAAILRRELGVLAAGALVAGGLCIRAALT
jgi:hypothetical protein